MSRLAELRAKLQQDKEQTNNNASNTGSGVRYRFWNTPEGSSTKLRFLPDADSDNIEFWVEKMTINLPFQGIKGESSQECFVTVPCMETWKKKCPIQTEIRPWWSNEDTIADARKYYKKRSYIFQGFVVTDGTDEENPPENPIRIFEMNKKLTDIIKQSLMDPDMEEMPTDYDGGCDFVINVTKSGQYKSYDTSAWARKNRSLNDEEREAIDQYGLNDLKEFLPNEPSQEELGIIMDMFRASYDGEAYDPELWSNYYKPYGLSSDTSSSTSNKESVKKVKEEASGEADSDSSEESSTGGMSALERLRARRKGN